MIKTNIDEDSKLADLLNFNYKFKDINQDISVLDTYDNIRLQTGDFDEVETFKQFIKNMHRL
ncbi:MAG: hypothetical protein V8R82_11260 [Clostridia bacterium]